MNDIESYLQEEEVSDRICRLLLPQTSAQSDAEFAGVDFEVDELPEPIYYMRTKPADTEEPALCCQKKPSAVRSLVRPHHLVPSSKEVQGIIGSSLIFHSPNIDASDLASANKGMLSSTRMVISLHSQDGLEIQTNANRGQLFGDDHDGTLVDRTLQLSTGGLPSMQDDNDSICQEESDEISPEFITFGLGSPHPTSWEYRQRHKAHYNFRTGLKIHHSIQNRRGTRSQVSGESDLWK